MYTFTKLHDRRIPNVGVRVGSVEFQLNAAPLVQTEQDGMHDTCMISLTITITYC